MASSWGDSWGTSWGDSWGEGIGIAPAVVAEAVRPPPVDFVIASPLWRQGFVTPAPVYEKMPATVKEEEHEASELDDMMQMYLRWKKLM